MSNPNVDNHFIFDISTEDNCNGEIVVTNSADGEIFVTNARSKNNKIYLGISDGNSLDTTNPYIGMYLEIDQAKSLIKLLKKALTDL